tara:strand:+ start:990 stop:1928 length:939 start_codon:yes stop_codon:yes gene_type:complete
MLNILYISARGVLSEGYMYRYYRGLYKELCKISNVKAYEGIVDAKDAENFDCIIFDLGYFAQKDPKVFQEIPGLKELKIPKIAYFHKPQTMLQEKLDFCKINNFDLFVDSQITYTNHGNIANCDSIRLPFVASEKYFYPRNVEKIYDVGFSGAHHGMGKVQGETRDIRDKAYNLIHEKNYELYWNSHKSPANRTHSIDEYATKINQSTIWFATTGPTLDISPRYFEVMLSKTLLCCNNMPYEYEGMFVDGENCIIFENDLSNLTDKIDYYLENHDERNRIISNAYDFAKENYTWMAMAKRLVSKIEEIKDEL